VKSPKSLAKSLINRLPDDVSWEQIQYRIYALAEIAKGGKDFENEQFVPLEEMEKIFQVNEEFVYELLPEEESMIDEAEEEFDAGLGMSYDVYLREMEQWFEEIDKKCNC